MQLHVLSFKRTSVLLNMYQLNTLALRKKKEFLYQLKLFSSAFRAFLYLYIGKMLFLQVA